MEITRCTKKGTIKEHPYPGDDAGWEERLRFGLEVIKRSRTVFTERFEKPPYTDVGVKGGVSI